MSKLQSIFFLPQFFLISSLLKTLTGIVDHVLLIEQVVEVPGNIQQTTVLSSLETQRVGHADPCRGVEGHHLGDHLYGILAGTWQRGLPIHLAKRGLFIRF